jgi:ubiquinone/menaquinone biosynthesis C-methylase UbiE
MLDHTIRRAADEGIGNIEPHRGDARELPFADAMFDAALMVAVLGEIPDQAAALREIRRVLKPGGRLVVGELFGDPHMVTENALRQRGEHAGLRLVRRVGPRLGYFAKLVPVE